MSLGARRSILLACAVLVSLGMLEGLLRLDARLRDPAPADLSELLVRSEVAEPNREIRARSLRGLVRPSADPELVYELKPGLEAVFKGRPLRINSLGMRGAEVTIEKPEGTRRIVGLGDSVMFGWGVHEEESYLALLQRCLDRRQEDAGGPRTEVLDFAVPGYNTWMEVAALRGKAAHVAPDLVVLHMTANDLELPAFMTHEPPARGWARSMTVRYARRALGFEPSLPPLLSPPEVRRLAAEGREVEGRYAHMAGSAGVRSALAHLARAADGLGDVPVVVLLLDERSEPGRFFAEEARRHGFRVATFGEAFASTLAEGGGEATAERWRETFWLSAKDPHPNALGHAVIAEVLRRAIAELWGTDRVCRGIDWEPSAAGRSARPTPASRLFEAEDVRRRRLRPEGMAHPSR